MRGWWIAVVLVIVGLLLMYHDTINNVGTSSPFDPNELNDVDTSHEQFVVVAFTLAAIFLIFPLDLIKRHPFPMAAIVVLVLAGTMIVAQILCPCPVF